MPDDNFISWNEGIHISIASRNNALAVWIVLGCQKHALLRAEKWQASWSAIHMRIYLISCAVLWYEIKKMLYWLKLPSQHAPNCIGQSSLYVKLVAHFSISILTKKSFTELFGVPAKKASLHEHIWKCSMRRWSCWRVAWAGIIRDLDKRGKGAYPIVETL